MSFNLRLQKFIDHEGLTPYLFNKRCGFTRGLINNALVNQGMNSTSLEQMLRAFPNLNVDWLITGRGQMLLVGEDGRAQAVRPTPLKGSKAPEPLPRDLEESLYRQVVWHLLQQPGYMQMHDRLNEILAQLETTQSRSKDLIDQLTRIKQMVEMQFQIQPQDHGIYEMTLRIAAGEDGKYTPTLLSDPNEIQARMIRHLTRK